MLNNSKWLVLALAGVLGCALVAALAAPDAAAGPQAKQTAPKAAPKAPPKKAAKAPAGEAQRPAAKLRDPFEPLIARTRPGQAQIPERLPPGKPGLVISQLRIHGIVRSPSGMIAVVSNPQNKVYFLHEGERIYDGQVEKITMEAVAFRESSKDPLGKTVTRTVTKPLYPKAGEQ